LLTPTGVVNLLVSRFTRGTGVTADAEAAEAGGTAEAAEARRRWLFIRLAVLVPLSVFAVFSLRHDVKIDWTGAPWLGAVPALATSIVWFGTKGVRGIRAWVYSAWGPTAVFMLLLYAVGLHYLALGLPGVRYSSRLELVPVGWRDLGRQINAIADDVRRQTGMEPVIVGMDRYELASQLTFYAPDHARSVKETSSRNLFGQNGLMYGRWASSLAVGNRTLVLVAWDPHDVSDELTSGYVATLGPLQEGVLTRGSTEIRNFHYRIARGLAADLVPGQPGERQRH
jgi:dolichol-phosphate mannosyltransferase